MKLTHLLSLIGVFLVLLTVAVTQEITVKHNGTLAMKTRLAFAQVTGTVTISPSPIVAGQPITLTVSDADLISVATTTVTIQNSATGQSIVVTLTQTGAGTGVFTGTLSTANATGVGTSTVLNVQDGNSVTVTYIDALKIDGTSGSVTAVASVTAPATATTPTTVTGVTSTFLNSSSVRLNWDKNSSAGVTGYKLYFGTASRLYNGTSAEGASPLGFGNRSTTTKTLTHLPAPVLPSLPVVANVALAPQNQAIAVSWSATAGATGYKIYYSTTSFDSGTLPTNPVPITVGNTTSYTLTGLTNGTRYYVAVTAIAEPRYYFAVTAAKDFTAASNPGSTNESAYSAEASTVMNSTIAEGTFTPPPASIIPEVIVAFPNLKNEGCFIATAAFGFYSAPQVQVLRDFRDRYLLTNAPGRAFVAWYYHYGPQGAHFLNQHPIFKPVVRLALLPLIVVALFLISTPVAVKILVMLSMIITSAFLVRRRILLCNGGVQ